MVHVLSSEDYMWEIRYHLLGELGYLFGRSYYHKRYDWAFCQSIWQRAVSVRLEPFFLFCFLKFMQYVDFFVYVTMEPGSLHQDIRLAGCVPHRVPVIDELLTE